MLSKLRLALVLALASGLLTVATAASAAVPNCDGLVPTIAGTTGPDTLVGTPGDDVIHGKGGDDTIDGRGGNDVICGGLGNDIIDASDGDDRVFGQGGDDQIRGGPGADFLNGGNGDDTLRGNVGNDELQGKAGDDTLLGYGGDDILKGGPGANTLNGGDGNDEMYGGNSSDTITGGNGDDFAQGNKGADEISGDAGNDDLRGGGGDDIILGGADIDAAVGGDGFDRCIDVETAGKCEDDDFNDAPIAADDVLTTDEDTAVAANVLADNGAGADSDPNGDALTVSAVNGNPALVGVPVALPSGVSVTVGADGALSYDPSGLLDELDSGDEVADGFTYTASDGSESDDAMVTITVSGVNDAPEADDDTAEVDEDDSVVIDVLDNDSDVDGDELDVVFFTDGDNGSVVLNGDGTLTYTPDENFNGSDSFTYDAGDGDATDGATVIIGVVAVNDEPVAADDTASVDEDDSVEIDVLDNDNDVDGDELEVVFVSDPDNGTAEIDEETGLPVYTPDENFNGVDTFTYIVTDNEPLSGDIATVTVTVDPVNDDPTADDDTAEVDEDSSVIIDVLDNDDDVDGDDLTPVIGTVSDGDAVVNGDGTITYTPDPDFFGEATITYTADDGNGGTSEPATVTVTVNGTPDDPVAEDDDIAAVEDGPAVLGNLVDNDDDVDGDELIVIEVGGDPVPFGGSHTEVLLNGSIQVFWDGDYIFTPDEDADDTPLGGSLDDTFTYVIDDGTGRTDAAIGTVTLTGINDAPVASDDPDGAPYVTDEETAITLTDLLDNDSDVDSGDVLFVSDVDETSSEGASVTITEGGDVLYDPSGELDNIPLGGSVVDTFTYTVADGNGGTDTATVSITVNGVNDDPTAAADEVEITEDTFEVFIDVLDNDTDPDDGETATLDVTGIVVLDAVGQITPLGGVDDLIRYRPGDNFMDLHDDEEATDVFQYILEDVSGGLVYGTVTITITGINEPWDAVDDPSVETDEDTPVAIDVLDNDVADEEDDDPTVTIVPESGPTNGSVEVDENIITYTPDENFNGTDSFEYQIDDGFGGTDTATVTVTVNAVNDAPVAVADEATVGEDDETATSIDVLTNDTDVEEDELSLVSINTAGTVGTAVINGDNVDYDPNGQFEALDDGETAVDTFTYIANDGTDDSASGTVTVTINGANDAPVANDDSGELDEDSGTVTIDVLDNDTDVDLEDLTITAIVQPDNGTVTLVDGELVYEPDENFAGEDTFTYKASDGTDLSEDATVTVTVNAVNDAPVAVADSDETDEDNAVDVDVLDNDSDVDEDELTPMVVDQPTNGSAAVVDVDGSWYIRYTPDEHFNGSDSFTYKVNDGTEDSNTVTVDITVNAVNDAPVAVADSPEVGEDDGATLLTATLLSNDTDVEDDTRTIVGVDDTGTTGIVTFADGDVSYDPDGEFESLDDGESATTTFTYTINDGTDDSAPGTVTVTINGANDAPEADDDSGVGYVVPTGSVSFVTPNVLANDSDVDDEPLSVVEFDVDGTAGLVSYNLDGTFTYEPPTGPGALPEGTTDSWSYTVSDGDLTDTATVTIVINSQPVANDDPSETTDEDTAIVGGDSVLDNDTDAQSHTLTVSEVNGSALNVGVELTLASGALLTVYADGTYDYDPNGQFEDLIDAGDTAIDGFVYVATDGAFNGFSATAIVTITITGVNDDPVITSAASASVLENQTSAIDVQSTDVEGDVEGAGLTYAITGGDDGALFSIDLNTGVLTFDAAPDFEVPGDFNGDNDYEVEVTVTDSGGLTDVQTITITVTDVVEP